MKVFLTGRLHEFALKDLKSRYDVEVYSGKNPIPKAKLKLKIKDADGIICFPYDTVDADVIDSAKNLKVISTYSVGFDHVDIKYAKRKKIRVGHTPEVLTDATADLAFALILDVTRRVTEGDRIIRSGRWSEIYGAYDYLGTDISSKTLGILGLGRIGTALAKRAKVFGMDIIYHNRKRVTKSMEKALGATCVELDELVSKSDIISIHVPHTAETDGMFNAKMFKRMKKTAFLINTARGKIVNQEDLADALGRGVIAGAGIDVFKLEPIRTDDPLTRIENVVLAPHIGSSTAETRRKMTKIAVKNLDLGMSGRMPIYSVGY